MLGKTDWAGVSKLDVSEYAVHAWVGFMPCQHKKRVTEKAFTDFRAAMTLIGIMADSSCCGKCVCVGGVGCPLAN